MKVDLIAIKLSGKFKIENLKELGYQQKGNIWWFDGFQHRYIFKVISEKEIEVTIKKKPSSLIELMHDITFEQLKDWVGRSVNTIDIDNRRRNN